MRERGTERKLRTCPAVLCEEAVEWAMSVGEEGGRADADAGGDDDDDGDAVGGVKRTSMRRLRLKRPLLTRVGGDDRTAQQELG